MTGAGPIRRCAGGIALALVVAWGAGCAAWNPGAAASVEDHGQDARATDEHGQDAGATIDAAVEGGIAFLLEAQNPDGSWGSATRTKGLNIYAPVPGAHHAFRAAVTAMCISALIETGGDDPAVAAALERAEAWLDEWLPRVRRAEQTAIYNTWAHAYAVQALVRMHERHADDPERRRRIAELMDQQIDRLGRYEFVAGGWGYYDFAHHMRRPADAANSFTTATVLIALHEAAEAGFDVPDHLVERGVGVVQRQRRPDNTYLYSENFRFYTGRAINLPGGSLGRSQVCNAALRMHGDESITDAVLDEWLERLAVRGGWLDAGRKRPVPHEAPFAVAGYFYYYGHYYAAYCIDLLPPEMRPEHQRRLAATIIERQEADGSWWDYPLYNYHQPYGTAFALMTLARCR